MYYFGEDKGKIQEAFTPLAAAEYLGLEVRKKGSYWQILCPNPEHNDRHFGSCVISKGGTRCKCYACGKRISGIQMLMWDRGLSWYDAMSEAAEFLGLDKELDPKRKAAKRRPKLKYRLLTKEEQEFLGLDAEPKHGAVTGISLDRPENKCFMEEDGAYVVLNPTPYGQLRKLAVEDPEAYAAMVRTKALSRFDMLDRLIFGPVPVKNARAVSTVLKEFSIPLKPVVDEWVVLRAQAYQIYLDFGGKPFCRMREDAPARKEKEAV